MIRLTRPAHLLRPTGYFVQCNQTECQYVDANEPPCPLHVGMFSEEIKAAEAMTAAKTEAQERTKAKESEDSATGSVQQASTSRKAK